MRVFRAFMHEVRSILRCLQMSNSDRETRRETNCRVLSRRRQRCELRNILDDSELFRTEISKKMFTIFQDTAPRSID